MVVITVSKCPSSLKGDLAKWLTEIQTGLYVGSLSKRVRDRLWERVLKGIGSGRAIMIYSCRNEQGMGIRSYNTDFHPKSFDGIWLIFHPAEEKIQQGFPVNYCILDLETTGLNAESDAIIEIGAVRVREGKLTDKFERIVYTEKAIPQKIVEMTGLTNYTLENNGSPLKETLLELVDFVGEDTVVAHNIGFDLNFLEKAFNRCEMPFCLYHCEDAVSFFRRNLKELPDYKLNTVLKKLGLSRPTVHRALSDCEALYQAVAKVIEILPQ